MRKLIAFFILMLFGRIASAQTNDSIPVQQSDTIVAAVSDTIVSVAIDPKELRIAKQDSIIERMARDISDIEYRLRVMYAQGEYKMYPTENLYNLLKLDTHTGRIWQVQWSLKDSEEGTWTLNSEDLSYTGSCFELYPTQNMYQFILLDKTYGRTWHVQWGLESKKRWIKRIY